MLHFYMENIKKGEKVPISGANMVRNMKNKKS